MPIRNISHHCWAQHSLSSKRSRTMRTKFGPSEKRFSHSGRAKNGARAKRWKERGGEGKEGNGATCCLRLATVLRHVGCCLKMVNTSLSQQHPTCRNTSRQGGQTQAQCYAQQCCDMLRWHVAIF